jgi:hypothetical protein
MTQTNDVETSSSNVPFSAFEVDFFSRNNANAANVVWADSNGDVAALLRVDPRKYPAFWAWNQVRRLPGQVVAALLLGTVILTDGFVQLVG